MLPIAWVMTPENRRLPPCQALDARVYLATIVAYLLFLYMRGHFFNYKGNKYLCI